MKHFALLALLLCPVAAHAQGGKVHYVKGSSEKELVVKVGDVIRWDVATVDRDAAAGANLEFTKGGAIEPVSMRLLDKPLNQVVPRVLIEAMKSGSVEVDVHLVDADGERTGVSASIKIKVIP